MFYITGDTHRDFKRVVAFCDKVDNTTADTLIILGDAGINYYGGDKDRWFKRELSKLPITLFCIHGNHEQRPESVGGYEETPWHGGVVYAEPQFPNLLFAVESRLNIENWHVDAVLSHTVPLKYEPVETFTPGVDQSEVDKTTEIWLDGIEERLAYGRWFCGHFHINKIIDKVRFMFEDFLVFD